MAGGRFWRRWRPRWWREARTRSGELWENSAPGRCTRSLIAERMLDRAALRPGALILDAGAQYGFFARRLAERHPEWFVVASDLDHGALARGRGGTARKSQGNLAAVVADVTVPFTRNRFDAAVALECLTEIPDDRAALRSLARCLRPGGWLVVHVPDVRWRRVAPWGASEWRKSIRRGYERSSLEEMLTAQGFTVVRTRATVRWLGQAAQDTYHCAWRLPLRLRVLLLPLMRLAARADALGFDVGRAQAWCVLARLTDRSAADAGRGGG